MSSWSFHVTWLGSAVSTTLLDLSNALDGVTGEGVNKESFNVFALSCLN